MKNLFFALAFMLIGTFAFASTNEVNLKNTVASNTEITAMQSAPEVADIQVVRDNTLIVVLEGDDGTVIIIIIQY